MQGNGGTSPAYCELHCVWVHCVNDNRMHRGLIKVYIHVVLINELLVFIALKMKIQIHDVFINMCSYSLCPRCLYSALHQ